MHRQQTIRTAVIAAMAVTAGACQRAGGGEGDTAVAPAASRESGRLPTPLPDSGLPVDGAVVGGDQTAPPASVSGTTRGRTSPSGAASPPVAVDTVRGTVAEVGSVPVTSIVVRPAGGGRPVTIAGELAREIGRAAGAEVWVAGHRRGDELEVVRYAVRTVDGQPAIDGVVSVEGDRVLLATPGGRHVVARPPQALRALHGARVWLVGALDGNITSYGVLHDAP